MLPSLRKAGSYIINRNIWELKNENAIHWKVVECLRKYYPDAILIPRLGENQSTSWKRIDSWRKGYTAGSADLIIGVRNRGYNGLAMELKTPQGTGVLDEKQQKYLHTLQNY